MWLGRQWWEVTQLASAADALDVYMSDESLPAIMNATRAVSQLMRLWAERKVPMRMLLGPKLVPTTGTPACKCEASFILACR